MIERVKLSQARVNDRRIRVNYRNFFSLLKLTSYIKKPINDHTIEVRICENPFYRKFIIVVICTMLLIHISCLILAIFGDFNRTN